MLNNFKALMNSLHRQTYKLKTHTQLQCAHTQAYVYTNTHILAMLKYVHAL